MSRLTLATPWRELPRGWRRVFRAGMVLALGLPLCAFAYLQRHSPYAPSWEDWFSPRDVLRMLGKGLPWAGAVGLVAFSGRRRPLCLAVLAVAAALAVGWLLVEAGRFQPLLWKGRSVPVRRMVSTHCLPDYEDARPVVLRAPQDLEVWRQAVETEAAPLEEKPPVPEVGFPAEMGLVVDESYRALDHLELREHGGVLHVLAVRRARWVPSRISLNLTYERTPIVVAAMDRTTLPVEFREASVRGFGDDFPEWLARFLCFWERPIPLGAELRH